MKIPNRTKPKSKLSQKFVCERNSKSVWSIITDVGLEKRFAVECGRQARETIFLTLLFFRIGRL